MPRDASAFSLAAQGVYCAAAMAQEQQEEELEEEEGSIQPASFGVAGGASLSSASSALQRQEEEEEPRCCASSASSISSALDEGLRSLAASLLEEQQRSRDLESQLEAARAAEQALQAEVEHLRQGASMSFDIPVPTFVTSRVLHGLDC